MTDVKTYLITGAAGFIGSAFVRILLADSEPKQIVVLDALTYAGNIDNIREFIEDGSIIFEHGNICDKDFVNRVLEQYEPQYLVNFAAETHVDRSVDSPEPFVTTNINGVFNLLECARLQRKAQSMGNKPQTLTTFLQVSTDEVYGDLEIGTARHDVAASAIAGRDVTMYGDDSFSEHTPIRPSSPYSASKSAADMLVLSYSRSFGLPTIVSRCSNNYGPRQFPEKLIPLMVNNILNGKALPVYGQGLNVRDWIHVDDHCRGILAALRSGKHGEVYNFGGYSERRNIDLVRDMISIVRDIASNDADLSSRYPQASLASEELISYVTDRPGHDRRYAIDAGKAHRELGWTPQIDIHEGLKDTVKWYLDNEEWVRAIVQGDYREYYNKMYENR